MIYQHTAVCSTQYLILSNAGEYLPKPKTQY